MGVYTIKAFLISPDIEFTNQVAELVSKVEDIEIVGDANNQKSALARLSELLPNVVLIDEQITGGPFSLAEEITQLFVNMAVIILAKPPLEDHLRKAIQVGARDVLAKPVEAAPLVESVYAAYEYQKKRKVLLPIKTTDESRSRKTKIITVFSNKGGVGTSTIAVNLAVALARDFHRRTILWDLDLHHGVVSVATNIVQRRHLMDLINDVQSLDEDLLESYLEKHESGLMILPAPFTPEFADFITADHVNQILSVAKERWDYIIIDTASFFHEPVVSALRQSDLVLLIGSLDVGSIKNLRACLVVLDKLNFSRVRLRLVVNRVGREFGVYLKDMEATLKIPVFATIPSDAKSVLTGLNLGVPAAYGQSTSEFGRSINLLAKAIVGEQE